MNTIFAFDHVTKRFGMQTALDDVSLAVPHPSIVGLVGKNGCGKTTLLNHVVGLALPTSGSCTTLDCPTPTLGPKELSRIGVVHQQSKFLGWMRIEQLLHYVSTFYDHWDKQLEGQLMARLELDPRARIRTLSPGAVQKVALIVATCHRPRLLLLDEPLSDLDPIARQDVLTMLLECFRRDEVTIIVSSHMLHDLETIVDRILCLNRGMLVADAPLDELMERYAEWTITSRDGQLPVTWPHPFVRSYEGDRFRALIVVEDPIHHLDAFQSTLGDAAIELESRPLNLERIFRVLASGNQLGTIADADVAASGAGSSRASQGRTVK